MYHKTREVEEINDKIRNEMLKKLTNQNKTSNLKPKYFFIKLFKVSRIIKFLEIFSINRILNYFITKNNLINTLFDHFLSI